MTHRHTKNKSQKKLFLLIYSLEFQFHGIVYLIYSKNILEMFIYIWELSRRGEFEDTTWKFQVLEHSLHLFLRFF